jgi:hypothetical protein
LLQLPIASLGRVPTKLMRRPKHELGQAKQDHPSANCEENPIHASAVFR